MQNVIIDSKALEDLGLSEVIYLFEYDLPSAFKDNNTISERFTKEQAVFFREVRNKVIYSLKYKLNASKNLFSSWILEEEKLELAEKFAESVRNELIAKGFSDFAEKIKIIPITTTKEGFQTYEERKEEFYLEFLAEAQQIIDKGLKTKLLSDSLLWRAKKASEIVSILKEGLKDKSRKSRYNEIIDTQSALDDSISRFEALKEKTKKAKEKASTKEKKDAKRAKLNDIQTRIKKANVKKA